MKANELKALLATEKTLTLSAWGTPCEPGEHRYTIRVDQSEYGEPNLYVVDIRPPEGLSSGIYANSHDAMRWIAGRILFEV